ncbi:uncharacterized protein JCM15063_001026 [Sporobolomyces koalae]|uniref:uncharacterized protein n=1 Tax=Sporobolomyces koalae TaxID=500713 RepID=UPI003178A956
MFNISAPSSIPILGTENYAAWNSVFKAYAGSQGVYQWIACRGEEKRKRSNSESTADYEVYEAEVMVGDAWVLGAIHATIDATNRDLIHGEETAFGALTTLRKHHRKFVHRTFTTFIETKLEEGGDLAAHILKMRKLQNEFTTFASIADDDEIRFDISDKPLAIILLSSLPPSFSKLRKFMYSDLSDLTTSNIYSFLTMWAARSDVAG